MLKTALCIYGALAVPASIFALALCRAAARGDRLTELALESGKGVVDLDRNTDATWNEKIEQNHHPVPVS